ncbi:hypothetical protein IEQ34_019159 [Dendrobium chrysotoxum]|uniref:EF-hand domain-containing protein n=1 Tax=Dendrobium chrysotoxum TaxID=161865 RepID=A0AAV7FQI1_DENCH|nr:hypothetical protein IEQ34_019159 [Dendrobium chrysotoxum]
MEPAKNCWQGAAFAGPSCSSEVSDVHRQLGPLSISCSLDLYFTVEALIIHNGKVESWGHLWKKRGENTMQVGSDPTLSLGTDGHSFLEFLAGLLYNHPSPPIAALQFHLRKFRSFNSFQMAGQAFEFEDFLPIIAEKLGEDGLMAELCNGFRLLMDPARGLITFDSLKRNAALLGLNGMRDDELRGMLMEGDLDGDGALNEMEFCALMVRLSPELMEESWRLVDEAFQQRVRSP